MTADPIPIALRLTTNSTTADAATAAIIDTSTVGQSYCTGTGSCSASIPR